jgi:hypothetical protein
MKNIFTFLFLLFVLVAKAQHCKNISSTDYKINKTSFVKGDTIEIILYNNYGIPMLYKNWGNDCWFSRDKKYGSCGIDYPTLTLQPGDSLHFSTVAKLDGTYYFEFSMSDVIPTIEYQCIGLKFKVENPADKKKK